MTFNPIQMAFISTLLAFTIIFIIAAYVIESLALYRMGKKAGITWAWVAWIPGGVTFVVARIVRWKYWALFPILTIVGAVFAIILEVGLLAYLSMSSSVISTVSAASSSPSNVSWISGMPAMGVIVMIVMEFLMIAISIFILVQWGQMLERFGYSYAWLIWNFMPFVGTIVFFVILLRIAYRNQVQYQDSAPRTMFGSIIRE